ncbi:hypothetical protein R1sor_027497 [Riccia sorocarpa]|uniref:Cytochrome c oxidase copper chaperone n=1 Tax=Riccia sorocarpa TaxID=122646 RepID=A0ABD3GGH9_9MARC
MREVTGASSANVVSNTTTIDSVAGSSRAGDIASNSVNASAPVPKKKICCACPTTKKLRDECMVMHGEEACTKWIEAHKECLRSEGFSVWLLYLLNGMRQTKDLKQYGRSMVKPA